ncbi:hypothetical protein [Paenibacillus terrigena]|uniref:hypothetical protein n=1 Tax=Paenibacillus terrigena TaxID=369333 RepID=UPI0003705B5C|nr:hypothetical protein [Paenibacillus terrigena]
MDRRYSMARFNEDIPEPYVVAECAQCGGDIYEGDEVSRIDDGGGYVHDRCATTYAMERVYDAAGIIGKDGEIN